MAAVAWPRAMGGTGGRGRRGIAFAVALSILLHGALFLVPRPSATSSASASAPGGPLVVELLAVPAPAPEAAPPARAEPAARPRAPVPTVPRELTVPRSSRAVEPPPPPVPPPVPQAAPRPEPAVDMLAFMQANRERRRRAEAAAARGAGGDRGTAEAGASSLDSNLRSLGRADGTGGVFQVLRVGARTGEFLFNGWTRERGRQWRELVEVDAGPGGDVERAIVRRMIALIREHYTGNFNWESHRLGRVVVLSAAPENNEELEDYLMREFFGTPAVRRPGG